jgi:hypothetical protein
MKELVIPIANKSLTGAEVWELCNPGEVIQSESDAKQTPDETRKDREASSKTSPASVSFYAFSTAHSPLPL